jgi:hypothetical protein
MLGELIGEETGKVTGFRVLDHVGHDLGVTSKPDRQQIRRFPLAIALYLIGYWQVDGER